MFSRKLLLPAFAFVIGAILSQGTAQAQNGTRYQIQVRAQGYNTTQWWPAGGGSYDFATACQVINDLQSNRSVWRYVSYRVVDSQPRFRVVVYRWQGWSGWQKIYDQTGVASAVRDVYDRYNGMTGYRVTLTRVN